MDASPTPSMHDHRAQRAVLREDPDPAMRVLVAETLANLAAQKGFGPSPRRSGRSKPASASLEQTIPTLRKTCATSAACRTNLAT